MSRHSARRPTLLLSPQPLPASAKPDVPQELGCGLRCSADPLSREGLFQVPFWRLSRPGDQSTVTQPAGAGLDFTSSQSRTLPAACPAQDQALAAPGQTCPKLHSCQQKIKATSTWTGKGMSLCLASHGLRSPGFSRLCCPCFM